MWASCRDWQFCISIFLHLLSTFSITAWPNVSLWLLCHENNTLRTFEIIPSTSFYHGYIYRRLVRWDSKNLVWLSILLKSSQSDLFSRNLVLSRAVFDSFSFGFRCFLILLKEAWESNNEQMSRFHVQPRLEIPWHWRKGHKNLLSYEKGNQLSKSYNLFWFVCVSYLVRIMD